MRIEDGVLFDVMAEDINEDGSFVVPNSIAIIGDEAFHDYECRRKLRTITMPNTVVLIGHRAFVGCYNLSYINNMQNVKHIGRKAFQWCYNLDADMRNDLYKRFSKEIFSDTIIKY